MLGVVRQGPVQIPLVLASSTAPATLLAVADNGLEV